MVYHPLTSSARVVITTKQQLDKASSVVGARQMGSPAALLNSSFAHHFHLHLRQHNHSRPMLAAAPSTARDDQTVQY